MVSFKTTSQELGLIQDIAARALVLFRRAELEPAKLSDMAMDLAAVHANGCPLDLAALAGFQENDFAHDVFGIRRHLDRTTGKLGSCFVPRCAR